MDFEYPLRAANETWKCSSNIICAIFAATEDPPPPAKLAPRFGATRIAFFLGMKTSPGLEKTDG